jgi:3-phenylpropionate/cinnamic acid dioxygenase small subunit
MIDETTSAAGLEAQVRALVDRAAISDLLFSYARCVDTRDWDGFVANFTDDAVLEYPWEGEWRRHEGRTGLAEKLDRSFGRYHATQHISTNHQISVDQDTATSTSYLWSAHIRSADSQEDHWDVGGWYHCRYIRTADGWRFTHLDLEAVWQTGGLADILEAS